MRKLTVKRHKSIVGSAVTVNLYIAEEQSMEVVVNGTPFRKLGTAKNGAESTFDIPDGARWLVASVDDGLAKAIQSGRGTPPDIGPAVMDKILLPAHQSDIFVSGKNKFNPLQGNPFIFDKTN